MNPNLSDHPLRYSPDYRSSRAATENYLNDYSMRSFEAGNKLYFAGRHQNAIMAFKHCLRHDPGEIRAHVMLVLTYKSLKKEPDTLRHIEILRRLYPNPDFAQSLQKTIENWNYIPDSVGELPVTERNEIPYSTCSLFGFDGEFGNQLFQYAFARIYCEKYHMKFESYDWIGQRLFGLVDEPVSRILPFILEMEFHREDPFALPPLELGLCDRDFQGYFQADTIHYAPYKDQFRSFFRPVNVVERQMRTFESEVRARGGTLVAIHIRRGDADSQNRKAGSEIYREWLRELCPTLDRPVIFLASDDLKNVYPEFAEFNPITSEGVSLPIPKTGYYPDFYMLTQADYLAVSNSTFSITASMLNEKAVRFMRPNPANLALVPFDPWNTPPIN